MSVSLPDKVKRRFHLAFPRTHQRLWRWLHRQGAEAEAPRSRSDVFTDFYHDNRWGQSQSRSGAGSTLTSTESLREHLPRALARLQARSLLDVPCGDFYWMSRLDLPIEQYIGGDIVPAMIEDLRGQYGQPGREFVTLDVVSDPLPAADVLLCRDCLVHLPLADAEAALGNIVQAEVKYLMLSNHHGCRRNIDIPTGRWRSLNLHRPPFSLPPAAQSLPDPGEAQEPQRRVDLWPIEAIRQRYPPTETG